MVDVGAAPVVSVELAAALLIGAPGELVGEVEALLGVGVEVVVEVDPIEGGSG
jgi:hypothetical protein